MTNRVTHRTYRDTSEFTCEYSTFLRTKELVYYLGASEKHYENAVITGLKALHVIIKYKPWFKQKREIHTKFRVFLQLESGSR